MTQIIIISLLQILLFYRGLKNSMFVIMHLCSGIAKEGVDSSEAAMDTARTVIYWTAFFASFILEPLIYSL